MDLSGKNRRKVQPQIFKLLFIIMKRVRQQRWNDGMGSLDFGTCPDLPENFPELFVTPFPWCWYPISLTVLPIHKHKNVDFERKSLAKNKIEKLCQTHLNLEIAFHIKTDDEMLRYVMVKVDSCHSSEKKLSFFFSNRRFQKCEVMVAIADDWHVKYIGSMWPYPN